MVADVMIIAGDSSAVSPIKLSTNLKNEFLSMQGEFIDFVPVYVT